MRATSRAFSEILVGCATSHPHRILVVVLPPLLSLLLVTFWNNLFTRRPSSQLCLWGSVHEEFVFMQPRGFWRVLASWLGDGAGALGAQCSLSPSPVWIPALWSLECPIPEAVSRLSGTNGLAFYCFLSLQNEVSAPPSDVLFTTCAFVPPLRVLLTSLI